MTCQRINYKYALPAGRLIPIVTNYRNKIVWLDLLSPYPASRLERYKFILVKTNNLSKCVEIVPLRKASAKAIANALFENNVSRSRAPIKMVSDNGPQFISEVFEHICHRSMKIGTNGKSLAKQENRDQFLKFTYAIRTTVDKTTSKTPGALFFGRKFLAPFQKLVIVTDGADLVCGNIEKLFDKRSGILRFNRKDEQNQVRIYHPRKRDEDFVETEEVDGNRSRAAQTEGLDGNRSRAAQVVKENGNSYRIAAQVETEGNIGLAREERNNVEQWRGRGAGEKEPTKDKSCPGGPVPVHHEELRLPRKNQLGSDMSSLRVQVLMSCTTNDISAVGKRNPGGQVHTPCATKYVATGGQWYLEEQAHT
ncbi:retrovirus-related Pol polyprotein from transposon 17.6 [Trichonephila clavipes]|nr:retrovirus-related Pol polyprotein from transposon 17.6 [Trichonephila clavipes]